MLIKNKEISRKQLLFLLLPLGAIVMVGLAFGVGVMVGNNSNGQQNQPTGENSASQADLIFDEFLELPPASATTVFTSSSQNFASTQYLLDMPEGWLVREFSTSPSSYGAAFSSGRGIELVIWQPDKASVDKYSGQSAGSSSANSAGESGVAGCQTTQLGKLSTTAGDFSYSNTIKSFGYNTLKQIAAESGENNKLPLDFSESQSITTLCFSKPAAGKAESSARQTSSQTTPFGYIFIIENTTKASTAELIQNKSLALATIKTLRLI